MKAVLNNPYRLVGLLAGATAREQDRQIKRLIKYLEAGHKPPQDDYSFPFLGALDRRLEAVTNAASRLNLDSDKLNAALFWFYNGYSDADELALDALQESNVSLAESIWAKKTSAAEVNEKNCSAFQNFSTLLLCRSMTDDKPLDENSLERGIRMKLRFLDSDWVQELKTQTTDETFKITKIEIQLAFLNILQQELEQHSGITPIRWISLLAAFDFSAKDVYISSFIQRITEPVEKEIETACAKRNANKANAAVAGEELFRSVANELKEVQSALGMNHIKYALIADKVAEEILQCGIDYFDYCKNADNPAENFVAVSMNLSRKAQSLAVGALVGKRCDENIVELQEWVNGEPERNRQEKVKDDLEKLKLLIEEYDRKEQTIDNAKQFMLSASRYLLHCRNTLGANDNLYLAISSKIASDAQGMCIAEINELQDEVARSRDKSSAMKLLQIRIMDAWKIIGLIDSMDMEPDFKDSYYANRTSLKNLMRQLSNRNTHKPSTLQKILNHLIKKS